MGQPQWGCPKSFLGLLDAASITGRNRSPLILPAASARSKLDNANQVVITARFRRSCMTRAPSRSGFDFTTAMRALIADMIERLPELSHIDLDRVLISFTQTRKRVPHGIQATLTPMRFQQGRRTTRRRGHWYRIQACVDSAGREMLYVLSFYLPRFLDRPLDDKLVTILHELWHISPQFDGDLRRHPGRCYAHSHSQAQYDREMASLSKRWLETNPTRDLYAFLEGGFSELLQVHGRVFGMQIRRPRLIRVAEPEMAEREMEAVLQKKS